MNQLRNTETPWELESKVGSYYLAFLKFYVNDGNGIQYNNKPTQSNLVSLNQHSIIFEG